MEHLLRRYGSLTAELLRLMLDNPDLARPVDDAERYLRAEISYAVSHEGALRLEDVLARRTRIAMEFPDRGLAAAEEAAKVMGRVLGWTAQERQQEMTDYAESEGRGRPSRPLRDFSREA
jgi:glycerol-3-phosphate dehydrogenase